MDSLYLPAHSAKRVQVSRVYMFTANVNCRLGKNNIYVLSFLVLNVIHLHSPFTNHGALLPMYAYVPLVLSPNLKSANPIDSW